MAFYQAHVNRVCTEAGVPISEHGAPLLTVNHSVSALNLQRAAARRRKPASDPTKPGVAPSTPAFAASDSVERCCVHDSSPGTGMGAASTTTQNIRSPDREDSEAEVGYLTQGNWMFDGNLKSNMAVGILENSGGEVETAGLLKDVLSAGRSGKRNRQRQSNQEASRPLPIRVAHNDAMRLVMTSVTTALEGGVRGRHVNYEKAKNSIVGSTAAALQIIETAFDRIIRTLTADWDEKIARVRLRYSRDLASIAETEVPSAPSEAVRTQSAPPIGQSVIHISSGSRSDARNTGGSPFLHSSVDSTGSVEESKELSALGDFRHPRNQSASLGSLSQHAAPSPALPLGSIQTVHGVVNPHSATRGSGPINGGFIPIQSDVGNFPVGSQLDAANHVQVNPRSTRQSRRTSDGGASLVLPSSVRHEMLRGRFEHVKSPWFEGIEATQRHGATSTLQILSEIGESYGEYFAESVAQAVVVREQLLVTRSGLLTSKWQSLAYRMLFRQQVSVTTALRNSGFGIGMAQSSAAVMAVPASAGPKRPLIPQKRFEAPQKHAVTQASSQCQEAAQGTKTRHVSASAAQRTPVETETPAPDCAHRGTSGKRNSSSNPSTATGQSSSAISGASSSDVGSVPPLRRSGDRTTASSKPERRKQRHDLDSTDVSALHPDTSSS